MMGATMNTREMIARRRRWKHVLLAVCFALHGDFQGTASAFTLRTTTAACASSIPSSWKYGVLSAMDLGPIDSHYEIDTNDYRYSASDWLHNIRTLPKSTILKEIRGMALTVVLWSGFVSVVYKSLLLTKGAGIAHKMCIHSTPHSFLVSSLGLLLVFRTNAAYQRFSEGRRIWENIHSISRSMSQMVTLYESDLGQERRKRVFRLLGAFPYLLKHHIKPSGLTFKTNQMLGDNALVLYEAVQRGSRPRSQHENRQRFVNGAAQKCCVDRRSLPWCLFPPLALRKCAESNNRPLWVCDRLSKEVADVKYSETFTSRERLTFLSSVGKLVHCIGECERIHQTAVPQNYARHSLRSLTLWLFSLPFALVKDLGLLTGPVMGLIAWLMLGIYQIGFEIEDPFTGSLRLQVLCDAIYRDLLYGLNPLNRRETAFKLQDELEEWDSLQAMSPASPDTLVQTTAIVIP